MSVRLSALFVCLSHFLGSESPKGPTQIYSKYYRCTKKYDSVRVGQTSGSGGVKWLWLMVSGHYI